MGLLDSTPWPVLGAAMRSARMARGFSLDLMARRLSIPKVDLALFEVGQQRLNQQVLEGMARELRLRGPEQLPGPGMGVCGWCGGGMTAVRSTRRFCGDTCRQAHHRGARPRARDSAGGGQ